MSRRIDNLEERWDGMTKRQITVNESAVEVADALGACLIRAGIRLTSLEGVAKKGTETEPPADKTRRQRTIVEDCTIAGDQRI